MPPISLWKWLGTSAEIVNRWPLKGRRRQIARAWEPFLFAEEDLPAIRQQRDPVAKAEPTLKARKKNDTRVTDGGFPVHSFDTLLREVARRVATPARSPALQAEALRLIDT